MKLIASERTGAHRHLFEDAEQEALIRFWERLEEGHPKGIAIYAARQAARDIGLGRRTMGSRTGRGVVDTHQRSVSLVRKDTIGEEYVFEPADDSALEAYRQIEAREVLSTALAALEPRDRLIVHRTYYEGLTQAEIAAELGVTRQAVSQRIKKALRTLRSHLEGVL